MIPTVDPHDLVQTWTARGWLRPLDRAFVMFLSKQERDASPLVLIGAALASHQLGRGHVCLDLRAVLADPDATLSLPPEGETGEPMPAKPSQILYKITIEQWEESFGNSSLVGTDTATTPLVLNSGRLYLRRYRHYTRRVAGEILSRVGRKFPVPDNLKERLDELFAPLRTPMERQKTEVHWQSVAAAVAATSASAAIIVPVCAPSHWASWANARPAMQTPVKARMKGAAMASTRRRFSTASPGGSPRRQSGGTSLVLAGFNVPGGLNLWFCNTTHTSDCGHLRPYAIALAPKQSDFT